jgi:hypothetical protein
MRNSTKMRHLSMIFTIIILGSNADPQNIDINIERIDKYEDFLKKVQTSAKDYILNQFQIYDIVILAERYHSEETQYDLINEIVNDSYFISEVGNICIEIGAENLSDSLNHYLKNNNDNLNQGIASLLAFQRDISWYPLWAKNNYHLFLRNLFLLNKSLEPSEKVNLYLTDIPFDWSIISNGTEYWTARRQNRDSIMAKNISNHFEKIQNSPRKKMLVILNEAHAISNTEWTDMWQKRTAQYLAEKYGRNKIASILINSVGTNENDEDILLQDGYWDAAFSIAEKTNIGFDLNNSPFGHDKFDYALGNNNDLFKYQDIFTGLVFYKPISQHRLSAGVNKIINSDFREEFLRRIKICDGEEYYEKLKVDIELIGWNKIEYYHYDRIDEKIAEIKMIKEKYLELKN